MSGERDAPDEEPAADALPDLVEDGAGWDAPLPDLAEADPGRPSGVPHGSQDVIG
ncbi:MAG: hypothetical protein F2817_17760, partial [Actinobacteria bacterium]|nr:hypothetical protein [Actinomycetota bacterium]